MHGYNYCMYLYSFLQRKYWTDLHEGLVVVVTVDHKFQVRFTGNYKVIYFTLFPLGDQPLAELHC